MLGDDTHGHAERVCVRGGVDRGIPGTDDPHLPLGGGGRRPRTGHHPGVRGGERAAVLHQSYSSVHDQHDRRAPGHVDGVPPPGQVRTI